MRTRAATAVGILSLATAVSATGSAIINNNCAHDVYVWPVSVDQAASSPTVIKAGGAPFTKQYTECTSGGWSLKLSDTDDISGPITQFEYTLGGGTIWYDLSNVNCFPFGLGTCPFAATGMFLQSGSGCPTANCEPGNATCHDAYTYPKDDWASLSCESSADTVLDLCGTSSGSSSSGSGGIVGQLTSAAGSLLGLGDSTSSEAAPSTSATPTTTAEPTTSTTPTPTPTPTTSTTPTTTSTPTSTVAKASHKHWSPPAAVSADHGVAAAAFDSSSAEATPTTPSAVATTLETVALVTTAPAANPNIVYVYETETEMVSTTVIYQHKMFHKEKRGTAHPHARRHQHEQ